MKYQPYSDFYMPHNKYELANWLYKRYPESSLNKWLKMTSKRLKAIYIAIRSRKG